MIELIIWGYFTYFNIITILNYNSNLNKNEKIIFRIYPKNIFILFVIILSIGRIGYSLWDLYDIYFIQNKIILLDNVFSIITFIILILSYIEWSILLISSIIILSRKSYIFENKIVTKYGIFKFENLINVRLENEKLISFDLRKRTIMSVFSSKKFRTKDNNINEVLEYIKDRIIK